MAEDSEVPVQLVDSNDVPLGPGFREEIFSKGLLHRVVRIVLQDENGEILIQKRQMGKRLFPGCWDSSAAGHVDYGEEYLQAAKREMHEELGLDGIELHEVAYYKSSGKDGHKVLNRFTKIFAGVIPRSTDFRLQESEVESVDWKTPSELRKLISEQPGNVTDGLHQIAEHWNVLQPE